MRSLVSFSFVLSCFFSSIAQADEPFRFGAILALSGELASMGVACKNGMTLASEKIKEIEATEGSFEIVFEDDQNQPAKTVSAFTKLADLDKVDAVLTWASNTSKAVAPLAEKRRIPLLAIASDPSVVKGRNYTYTIWVSPATEAKLLVAEAKKRGYQRIARLSAIQDGTLAIAAAFDKEQGETFQIVFDEQVSLDTKDFRSQLTKIRQINNIDALFVNMYPLQVASFTKQARALGLDQPFFAAEMFEDEAAVKASNGAMLDQWYVQADDPSDAFLTKYKEKFPSASSLTAANCHDAALLAFKASQKVRQQEVKEVMSYLKTVSDFEGALGTFSATGDNRFSLPAAVKIVTKDGFKKKYP